jgi:hypothetical protein
MPPRPKPKRRWPRRLVGDTPGLRGRFRHEYPTIPIDPEPGSAYRAWLNAERRTRARKSSKGQDAPLADHPLLRDAFLREHCPRHTPHPAYWHTRGTFYCHWLRDHGVDPETGKMTDAGLAFFKQLLAEEDERPRANPDWRRRAA